MKTYDCIVVGVGGVGSAALWEAAKRGWSVLGIDQFGPAHDRGSSHGQSRIIRRAYFEHPNYVPLVNHAYDLWDELTRRHRTAPEVKELLTNTGLLQVGHPESPVIRGVQASADQHGLMVERFSPAEIETRLPIFKIPQDHVGLFEPDAGVLRVELCVAAMIRQSLKLGAELVSDSAVSSWSIRDDGIIEVRTQAGCYRSSRLVIAGGAWSQSLLPDLDLRLKVLKTQQHWFQLDRVDQKLINRFPAFLFEQMDGEVYYGIPELDYLGMKVCEHTGGDLIEDPLKVDRELDRESLSRVVAFLKRAMNFGHHRLVHHSTCLYTMSPDQHFIVDQHPGCSQVTFAAGLSGHGFKFAPVIGKYLIELLGNSPQPDFDFLKLERLKS
jgi:sarcosine oxidase